MRLLFKECRRILGSLVYLLFVGVLVVFYITQFHQDMAWDTTDPREGFPSPFTVPVEGEDHGSRAAEVPEQVVPTAVMLLLEEYEAGVFAVYPAGFAKEIRPGQEVLDRIAGILREITGLSPAELAAIRTETFETMQAEGRPLIFGGPYGYPDYPVPVLVEYELFRRRMGEVDALLGGSSAYNPEELFQYGRVPITYEERLAEYEDFAYRDRVTGAYGRLFCDYIGIDIALFGAFVSVALLMSDRKSGAMESVYPRGKSSLAIASARYFAVVLMILAPVLALSLVPLAQLAAFAGGLGLAVDPLGFVKYILWWLLPTIMTVTGVGFVFTLLTDTPIGIAVQFLWGFLDFSSGMLIGGEPGFGLAIRHNTAGRLAAVEGLAGAITANRLFYTALSLALLGISVLLLELKRRGRLDVRGRLEKLRHTAKA